LIRYFLRFGSRNFLSILLLQVLNQIDKVWIGLYLGKTPVGYYSRAKRFATFSQSIFSYSINSVVAGTYAELKGNHPKLSEAFFKTNALLLRSGFFLGGLFALIAPEFIRLALGAKWMPMVDAFRLMLIFMLLDPIKLTLANLFVALGKPEHVLRARFIQLVVMVLGIFLLGPPLGINGVALAMNMMLVVGIGILLWQARACIDFSPTRLFAIPGLALVIGMILARTAIFLPGIPGSYWRTGLTKIIFFTATYGTILFLSERRNILDMVRVLGDSLFYQSK
jgi:O-antigen/teichoic acid export membrane protein